MKRMTTRKAERIVRRLSPLKFLKEKSARELDISSFTHMNMLEMRGGGGGLLDGHMLLMFNSGICVSMFACLKMRMDFNCGLMLVHSFLLAVRNAFVKKLQTTSSVSRFGAIRTFLFCYCLMLYFLIHKS